MLLNLRQAADYVSVSTEQMRTWIKEGKVPTMRCDGRKYIERIDLVMAMRRIGHCYTPKSYAYRIDEVID